MICVSFIIHITQIDELALLSITVHSYSFVHGSGINCISGFSQNKNRNHFIKAVLIFMKKTPKYAK